jgi:hypothetical protein
MQKVNWEKIGVYLALITGFYMIMNNIMDTKERIAKLEVKVEKLEEKK